MGTPLGPKNKYYIPRWAHWDCFGGIWVLVSCGLEPGWRVSHDSHDDPLKGLSGLLLRNRKQVTTLGEY